MSWLDANDLVQAAAIAVAAELRTMSWLDANDLVQAAAIVAALGITSWNRYQHLRFEAEVSRALADLFGGLASCQQNVSLLLEREATAERLSARGVAEE